MKKQEKLDIIGGAIRETEICRCWFTYDENFYYYYPNAVNDKFMVGQEENDFSLDGYCIRKISQLKKVEIKNDKCNQINQYIGLTKQIAMPAVDITSWKTIFDSLMLQNDFVIIEDEINEQFAIGLIEKTFQNKLYFKPFDADGVWDEAGLEIPYSRITTVKWATRYCQVWQKYLQDQKL